MTPLCLEVLLLCRIVLSSNDAFIVFPILACCSCGHKNAWPLGTGRYSSCLHKNPCPHGTLRCSSCLHKSPWPLGLRCVLFTLVALGLRGVLFARLGFGLRGVLLASKRALRGLCLRSVQTCHRCHVGPKCGALLQSLHDHGTQLRTASTHGTLWHFAMKLDELRHLKVNVCVQALLQLVVPKV